MPTPQEVKSLFRAFLRTGRQFPNYNVREYVKRRAGEKFREKLEEGEAVQKAWQKGLAELEVAKRQAVVYGLYARKEKSIMELPLEAFELRPTSESPQT